MSTPPTTQLVQGAFYSALDQQANATLSLKQLTALDWPTLIAAQAAFTPSAFYLDNAIPVSVPLRPTAAPADAYLPSDFSVALAANTLLSWALAVPLLLTSVADEFGSADGQLNPVAVPAPYYAAELAQFIGETTKVEAILSSAEYALGTGDDAVRDALNKVRGVPSSLSLDRDADHAPPLTRSPGRHRGLLDVRDPQRRGHVGRPRRQSLCRRVPGRRALPGQPGDCVLRRPRLPRGRHLPDGASLPAPVAAENARVLGLT